MFDSGISTRSEVIAKKTEECTELARFTLQDLLLGAIRRYMVQKLSESNPLLLPCLASENERRSTHNYASYRMSS